MIRETLRRLCQATLWPDGSIRRILIGPSRGLRYRLFPPYGLGPIFGQWEPYLQQIMVSLLEPGDVAYDVGGSYGLHSLLMARLVGPAGTVCTFEPHPEIFKACAANVRLNDFANVQLLNLALADKPGILAFTLSHHDGVSRMIRNPVDAGAFTVRCDAIDRLVAGRAIPPPTFVRIDVKGHESEVLAGARATVARHRPILAVELHHPEADRKVGHFLLDHGYVAFRQKSLEPIKDLEKGWPLPDAIHGPVLAVPRDAVAKYAWLSNPY